MTSVTYMLYGVPEYICDTAHKALKSKSAGRFLPQITYKTSRTLSNDLDDGSNWPEYALIVQSLGLLGECESRRRHIRLQRVHEPLRSSHDSKHLLSSGLIDLGRFVPFISHEAHKVTRLTGRIIENPSI